MSPKALGAVVLMGLACASSAPPSNPNHDGSASNGHRATVTPMDITAEDFQAPMLPMATVKLRDAYGGIHPVRVELALDEGARTRGLMWRHRLEEGKGMLFVFPREAIQSFWMRNTLIPLDMIFIGDDQTVKGIIPSAEPKTLVSRTIGKPSRYVLEVPGGWAEKIGVRVGAAVNFDGVPVGADDR